MKSNPARVGPYLIRFWGKKGKQAKGYASASTFQIYIKGRKFFSAPVTVPIEYKTRQQKHEFIHHILREIERILASKSLARKIKYREKKIEELKKKLKRSQKKVTKKKHRDQIKKYKEDIKNALERELKLPVKEKKEIKYKSQFQDKTIYSSRLESHIRIRKYYFFHDPITINEETVEEKLVAMLPFYKERAVSVYRKTTPKQRIFIVRLFYSYTFKGQERESAIGILRFEAHTEKVFLESIDELITHVISKFSQSSKRSKSYFEKGFMKEADINGMTVEYVKKWLS